MKMSLVLALLVLPPPLLLNILFVIIGYILDLLLVGVSLVEFVV